MNRIISFLIAGLLLLSLFPVNSMAAENTQIIYLENGDYIVETLSESVSRSAWERTGSRSKTYYNSDGTAVWKAVLTGTFTYDGTSSTCTDADISVTVYASNWYTVSKSAGKSGNTATGTVTMGHKIMGVTTQKITANLTLTCDKNGNLS